MARKSSNQPRKPRVGVATARPTDAPEAAEVIETEAVPVELLEEVPAVDDALATTPASASEDDGASLVDRVVDDSRLPGLDESESGGAVVPYDPLSRYLSEIRRFPLLSREEESAIAHRYLDFHDPADAYRLVTANLRLVVKIAHEFARASRNLLDLIQEGNVGLMEAVRNFDPYRGIRFPSYAVWWVRAYIYRYLINNWRLVKIGTTQAQRKLFFNLRKETERLEAEGFTAQPKLLAQRMGVKESEVREMQERMAQSEVSLDQPAGPNDDTPLGDALPDTAANPEEAAARLEWRAFARDQVEKFAATLTAKELEIFRARLMTEDPPTLQEVGERFKLSRERVRQIEARLKQRLREFIEEHAADVDQART
ncbi:MAG: RNA polymerase sigma factor RpoD/SigA [Candidatus Binataceae bacterium]